MSAYLVEVDDTKDGVCYPAIIGPFAVATTAAAFAEEMSMGEAAQGGQGGYSAVHVISDETAISPDRYRQDYAWRLGE